MNKLDLFFQIVMIIVLLSVSFNSVIHLVEMYRKAPDNTRVYLHDVSHDPLSIEIILDSISTDYEDETELYVVSNKYTGHELETGDHIVIIAATNRKGLTSYYTLIIRVVDVLSDSNPNELRTQ